MTPLLALRGYSGRAVVAICVAVVAATAGFAMPPLGLMLGLAVIALALSSRRELRVRPELRGWGLSLLAMIVGVIVVAITSLHTLLPFAVASAFALLDR